MPHTQLAKQSCQSGLLLTAMLLVLAFGPRMPPAASSPSWTKPCMLRSVPVLPYQGEQATLTGDVSISRTANLFHPPEVHRVPWLQRGAGGVGAAEGKDWSGDASVRSFANKKVGDDCVPLRRTHKRALLSCKVCRCCHSHAPQAGPPHVSGLGP